MKLSDGLFLESCRTVAADYEGRIEFEDRIVDNMCMQLVQKPELYDVLVLPNLYGDIVSDLAAASSAGWASRPAPTSARRPRSSSRSTARRPSTPASNKANPTALILSGALMLRHLGYPGRRRRASRPPSARSSPRAGPTTYDLGGTAGTQRVRRRHHRAPRRDRPASAATTAASRPAPTRSRIRQTRPLDDRASRAGASRPTPPPPKPRGTAALGFGATSAGRAGGSRRPSRGRSSRSARRTCSSAASC